MTEFSTGELKKQFSELKLFGRMSIDQWREISRVPGGYIYTTTVGHPDEPQASSVFIAYTDVKNDGAWTIGDAQ